MKKGNSGIKEREFVRIVQEARNTPEFKREINKFIQATRSVYKL